MTSQEAVKFGPITATTAAFALLGGIYEFAVNATWGGGTVKVEALGPDGSTWLSVGGANMTADGGWTAYLSPGQYRVNVATATGVYARLVAVRITP